MSEKCGFDIHTEHAPLVHKARDIRFQDAYTNGLLAALITDIGNGNLQASLEAYFSKVGIPIVGEEPLEPKNNSNLIFTTEYEFIPETLEVYLSGFLLDGDPSNTDPLRHYDIVTSGPNAYKEINFLIQPNVEGGLKKPPLQFESLSFNYAKRITFNTKGGT